MFDIGWSELLVIAIVALVVIGPKDLPHAFRTAGQWMAKARAMARDFQTHVDDLMRESQVDDLKREFTDMTRAPELDGLESELMAGHAREATPTQKLTKPVVEDVPPTPPAA